MAFDLTEASEQAFQQNLFPRAGEADCIGFHRSDRCGSGRHGGEAEMQAGGITVTERQMIVDQLAAETGGNCELTRPGEVSVESGVTIVGLTDVPSLMPTHASQLLSRNVASLTGLLVKDGELVLDWDDDILARSCVTRTATT